MSIGALGQRVRPRFPVAVHLFLLHEDKVLLLRRFNTGYEDGNYGVPAGHLDGDESVSQATIREAKEEVGIDIRPADLRVVGVMHRKSFEERVDFFLTASAWTGDPSNCEPDKCDEIAWCPLDALPANTIPYVRQALENYRSGIWFGEFGW